MLAPLKRYSRWLHSGWPAGTVEELPEVREDGSTAVPGLFVVGDLTGIPLLKFAADSGARAVETICADPGFEQGRGGVGPDGERVLDLVIVGAGPSGMSAALEARDRGLDTALLDSAGPFATIAGFPVGKPIYAYPSEMRPAGQLQIEGATREKLLERLREQTLADGLEVRAGRVERIARKGELLQVELTGEPPLLARRVIAAIGRSGDFRKLGVPGEDADKVMHRLHDPVDYQNQDVLVVGGGDSALETAVAIAQCGGRVTLSYRKPELSRPKPENLAAFQALVADPAAPVELESASSPRVTSSSGAWLRPEDARGSLRAELASRVTEIREGQVDLETAEGPKTLANDVVFAMTGREAPLGFYRRSGVPILGEWRTRTWISLVLVLLAAVFVYHWKKGGVHLGIHELFAERGWFPFGVPEAWQALGGAFADPATLLGTLAISLGEPGFYYSLAYCLCVVIFGIRRIRRRRTPYVTLQTATLAAIQVIPLFLLPYAILPWMGNNGLFDGGLLGSIADEFFPLANYGHGREYWRAFGIILAWPLFFWNVFTSQPLWGWLAVSFLQTFVLIPLIVRRWGKGAYCGWICSCGALAETLGDTQRHKMPHGPGWNRLNLVGQVFLGLALLLLILRMIAWVIPDSGAAAAFQTLFHDLPVLNYVWFVDLLWAGILGVGLYWHFSGRVWCRFACPLAALMHIYARFGQYAILAEKKKCISCNSCTAICHQGIDVMSFANKGLPMRDPQCVRCSACVQVCPTGVLEFGRIDPRTGAELGRDRLRATPASGDSAPSSI